MTLGMLDLSIVTDRLIEQLKDCTTASGLWRNATPFKINYTGLAPDEARGEDGCQVSVYLFHVSVDKFHRNTFPTGGGAQPIPYQPLGLTLYYLLTAHSEKDYVQEQRAMSIAMKCFHEHPSVTVTVPVDPAHNREEEFTLVIEPQTTDEIARLWQAAATALRLSAVYRASVVFLEPPEPEAPDVVRHPPRFVPPNEIKALDEPPPVSTAAGAVKADLTGFVTVTIAGAGFATGLTAVRLRALALIEDTAATGPLAARRFRVTGADTLDVRVPLLTPAGRYPLTVQPTTDRRTFEIELTVPVTVDTVRPEAGLAIVAIDDARFASGAVSVALQQTPQAARVPLTETPNDPPGAGQFRVVDVDLLALGVPAGTTGRHRLHVRPAGARPELELWLDDAP